MGHNGFFACAYGVNIVEENVGTIQKSKEALLDSNKEVGLEVNPENTNQMSMLHYQKEGQKHSINIANRSFEDVAKFKYLGTKLTNQNCMNKEIKSRLNLVNACYDLVKSLLSSCLLFRNVKVKMYKA
jgi:hypothetical protein